MKNSEHVQRWREQKLARGLCIRCGKKPHMRNRTRCRDCAIADAARNQAYRTRQAQQQDQIAKFAPETRG